MRALEGVIPPIRRARGYYLYTQDGHRLIDLYRFGGAALLGYRPPRVVAVEKARLAQGLAAPLPTLYTGRLIAALTKRFPGQAHIRLARDADSARELLAGAGFPAPVDPALAPSAEVAAAAVAIWRPYLPLPARCRVVVPYLPYPAAWAPQPLCFASDPGNRIESQPVSPAALAGAVQALAAAARAEHERASHLAHSAKADRAAAAVMKAGDGASRSGRKPPQRPQRLFAELELARRGSGIWLQRGPYLSAQLDADSYAVLFRRFLDAGVLIAPAADEPTILPQQMSPGEFKLFEKLSKMKL